MVVVFGAKWKFSPRLVAWFLLYELQNDGKGSKMYRNKLKKRKLWSCTNESKASTVSLKKKKKEIDWEKKMLWSTEAYYYKINLSPLRLWKAKIVKHG